MPLNIAEGSGAFGGNRKQRYHSAMSSAYEVNACYEVAEAMQYIRPLSEEVRERPKIVYRTLINVLGLRRG